jgi:hypothetical protein
MKVPWVAHLFLWRVCNDILPTKEKLLKRKVVTNPNCRLCGLEVDMFGHVLWGCDATRAVWTESSRAIQKCAIEADEFHNIFSCLSDRLNQEELELATIIAQKLWLRRNQWVFEGTLIPPKCLIIGARDSLEKYWEANTSSSCFDAWDYSTQTVWKSPRADSVKVNWDATIDRRKNLMGVGVIACDHTGTVLAAQCLVQRYILDPTIAEAIGAKMGAELGRVLGLHSIFLEGDANVVVTALNREDEDFSRFGNIIVETREILKGFPWWNVSFVRRECNNAAHQLARFAVSQELN